MGVELVTPEGDDRVYRFIELHNGLRALLITDNPEDGDEDEEDSMEVDQDDDSKVIAAVCLSIQSGSMLDPDEHLGLAHLVEHLVFMGSVKFPGENEWDEFLSRNGGETNAFTQEFSTNFVFSVRKSVIEQALERFADLIFAPLLRAESLEREIKAVHQEFEIGLQEDDKRIQELVRSSSHRGRRFGRFCWGNHQSLANVLMEDIRDYYNLYYCIETAALTIYVPDSTLDGLEQWVTSSFSPYATKKSEIAPSIFGDFSYLSSLPCEFFRILPVDNRSILTISWYLPSFSSSFLFKPLDMIAHLLGSEIKDSLYFRLRKAGLVFGLSCGVDHDEFSRNQFFWMFSMDIELSIKGASNLDQVILIVFEHVNALHLIPMEDLERFWKDIEYLSRWFLRYREDMDPVDYVELLCFRLSEHCPLEYLLTCEELWFQFDHSVLNRAIEILQQSSFRIDFAHKPSRATPKFDFCQFIPEIVYKESWFNVEYGCSTVSDSFLFDLRNRSCDFVPVPKANSFLPSISKLLSKPKLTKKRNFLVFSDSIPATSLRLWMDWNMHFDSPRANVFALVSPGDVESDSPRKSLLSSLLATSIGDLISETLYTGELAGLSCSISSCSSSGGMIMALQGFSHKLFSFLDAILDSILSCSFTDFEERFVEFRHRLERRLEAAMIDPRDFASHVRKLLLSTNEYSIPELQSYLASISVDDLQCFFSYLKQNAIIDAFIHGNVSPGNAEAVVNSFKKRFSLSHTSRKSTSLIKIPPGFDITIRLQNQNKLDHNSVILNFYQVNSLDDARFRAKALLLVQMVSEKCFNQLRTQEQLGYEVSFDFYQKHDCVGFDVFIVSANHSPEFLNVRIEEFLVNVMNELHSISDSDFKDLKAGLHDELHDVDHNLSELGERLWGEIQELAFQFDRIERVLAEMEPVAKVDVLELFRQAFLDKARRRLSVQIYACKHKMQSEDSEDKDSFESKVILDSIPAISKAKASLL